MGNVLQAGDRPGAGAAGGHLRRHPRRRRRGHGQQGLRLGHAGRDVRGERHPLRRVRHRRRRRHGVDVERAVRAAAGARRLPHGQRQDDRRDDPRRPVGSVRRQAHGQLRRGVRDEVQRSRARSRTTFSLESYRRAQDATKNGKFKKEIAVVEIEGKKGKSVVIDDEEPFAAPLDKMAHAQAGVRRRTAARSPRRTRRRSTTARRRWS